MVKFRLGILNEHVQHLFAICEQISLNSGFRENDRLTARNPYLSHVIIPSTMSILKLSDRVEVLFNFHHFPDTETVNLQ